MESRKLELRFKDEADNDIKIVVTNPKNGISIDDIQPVVNDITTYKAFASSKGDLVSSFDNAVVITITEVELN